MTLKEASYINKSLTFLEQVVIALTERNREHIPYRQAKLTHYLKDSLGGNSDTLMIANIWPDGRHVEETASTMHFCRRMMKVTNDPQINYDLDPKLICGSFVTFIMRRQKCIVLAVSSTCLPSGQMFAIIKVSELPPKESFR